mgnify:CR=1 FL=1
MSYGNKKIRRNERNAIPQPISTSSPSIAPIQQTEAYRQPTQKVVKEAVKELNPDLNSLGSRG